MCALTKRDWFWFTCRDGGVETTRDNDQRDVHGNH